VIDIRTRPEWEETGIVPGSHLLTFFDERGKADPAAWLAKAKAIAKPGDPLVVICRSGNRTKALSQFLSQQADTRRSTTSGTASAPGSRRAGPWYCGADTGCLQCGRTC